MIKAITEDWDFVGLVWYFVFEGILFGILVWFDFGVFVCVCV